MLIYKPILPVIYISWYNYIMPEDEAILATSKVDTTHSKDDGLPTPEASRSSFNYERIELPRDKTGLLRCVFKVPLSVIGQSDDRRNLSTLFKHPLDSLKYTQDVFPEQTLVVKKSLVSVEKLFDYLKTQGISYDEDELHNLLLKPGVSKERDDLLYGITCCSLFSEDGEFKDEDDGEGWFLTTCYLIALKNNPGLAQTIKEIVLKRTSFVTTSESQVSSTDISENRPNYGNIPYEQISPVHVTNFLPVTNDGYTAIMPRIDTDGTPRNTVHFYINGMVEDHEFGSWAGSRYAVVTNLENILSNTKNGVPENIFGSDTFWSLCPSKGFQLPPGSTILVPKQDENNEALATYRSNDLNVIVYDGSLKEAIKQHFQTQVLPYISHSSKNTPSDADWEFHLTTDLPCVNHERSQRGKTENYWIAGEMNGLTDRLSLVKRMSELDPPQWIKAYERSGEIFPLASMCPYPSETNNFGKVSSRKILKIFLDGYRELIKAFIYDDEETTHPSLNKNDLVTWMLAGYI